MKSSIKLPRFIIHGMNGNELKWIFSQKCSEGFKIVTTLTSVLDMQWFPNLVWVVPGCRTNIYYFRPILNRSEHFLENIHFRSFRSFSSIPWTWVILWIIWCDFWWLLGLAYITISISEIRIEASQHSNTANTSMSPCPQTLSTFKRIWVILCDFWWLLGLAYNYIHQIEVSQHSNTANALMSPCSKFMVSSTGNFD